MPFDTEKISGLAQLEQELGPDFQVLPEGTYHFVFTDSSEVNMVNGFPRLRLSMEVLEGEAEGRVRSEWLGWYAKEDANAKKSFEERTATIRGMTLRFLKNTIHAISESPNTNKNTGQVLMDAMAGLGDHPEATSEQFEIIAEALVDVDFFGVIKHRTDKLTGDVREGLRHAKYEQDVSLVAV
jgi:hypothetical protein